jgi:hypothetical protein
MRDFLRGGIGKNVLGSGFQAISGNSNNLDTFDFRRVLS